MRVVFLNPPSLLSDTHDLAPPLWMLLLGTIARERGWDCQFLDLNLEVLARTVPLAPHSFYTKVLGEVLACEPDLICASSMALNGHVSLRILELLRLERPRLVQVVGGPHFSAVASQIVRHYPWIDAVCTGEAELPFELMLGCMESRGEIDSLRVPGVFTRNSSLRAAESLTSARSIPALDYSLIDLKRYFSVNPRHLFDFEAGRRGCIFNCRYCYAPQHFGRGQRTPPHEYFVAEMLRARSHGAKHLFIVTDNFVNYPQETAELCRRIAEAKAGLTFNCYATLSQLDEEVVTALAEARCSSIYVGVDAVHSSARKEFAKGLFRSNHDLLRRIDLCLAHRIVPTLAFLLEEPEKDRARFEDTVSTALTAAARGCRIAFNTLTLYPGTALAQNSSWQFRPCDLKARMCFDAPGIVQNNPYAALRPELFPFHSTHRPQAQQERLLLYAHVLTTLSSLAPEELFAICEAGGLLDLLSCLQKQMDFTAFAEWTHLQRRASTAEIFLEILRQSRFHAAQQA